MPKNPILTIVVPMYNREKFIRRCLESVLTQEFEDYEIIVVDDGSIDNSCAVVAAMKSARIRLLKHDKNQGRCPARNTGISQARSEWIVLLDSDDELIAGALATIARRIRDCDHSVGKLLFMCTLPDGRRSPDPAFRHEIWGYREYLEWLGLMYRKPAESLPVERRTALMEFRYPSGHRPELIHHLEMATRYKTMTCSDVVRRYTDDADNRVMNICMIERFPDDYADDFTEIIDRHGDSLRIEAFQVWRSNILLAACANFVAGRRGIGFRIVVAALRYCPVWPKLWVIAFLGMINAHLLLALIRKRVRG